MNNKGFTRYFGRGALYSVTPVSEQAVRELLPHVDALTGSDLNQSFAKFSRQMMTALWALKRIARKQAGFLHQAPCDTCEYVPETCDCPQCIAKDALERIQNEE